MRKKFLLSTLIFIGLAFVNLVSPSFSFARDIPLQNTNGHEVFSIPDIINDGQSFNLSYRSLFTNPCYAVKIYDNKTSNPIHPTNTTGTLCTHNGNPTPDKDAYAIMLGKANGSTPIQGLPAGWYTFAFDVQICGGGQTGAGDCTDTFVQRASTTVHVLENPYQTSISAKVCIKTDKDNCSNQGYMSDTYILSGTVTKVKDPKNLTVNYSLTDDSGSTYNGGNTKTDAKGDYNVDFSSIIQNLKNVQKNKDTGNKLSIIAQVSVSGKFYRSSPAYFTVLDFSPVQGSDDNCTKVSAAALSDCVEFPKDKKQYDADPAISCQTKGQYKCQSPDSDHFCASKDNHVMCQANDIPTIPVLPPCHQWSVNGKLQPTMPPVDSLKYDDAMDKINNMSGDKSCVSVETAIGDLSVRPDKFITSIFSVLLGIAGGLALILIIYSGYQIILSRGDPEKLKAGRERLLNTIIGLVFIICSMVILQFIAGDLLRIPGFGT